MAEPDERRRPIEWNVVVYLIVMISVLTGLLVGGWTLIGLVFGLL